eukprot:CAMPEP_0197236244 /NCGR_PEP_ID=MMETSP1429-20130617/3425_1 /TAXON_ID=49237 /ORGANISM="Chaetoceros  sp., Strain UNC1202" /LENGTH=324 /DNA_ID=CAMNT_0042694999 /DNA_START=107 /DNA_END=1081 /DNA_ORIENTATION=+
MVKLQRLARDKPKSKATAVLLMTMTLALVFSTVKMSRSDVAAFIYDNSSTLSTAAQDTTTNEDRFSLAKKESLGFFDDIDSTDWRRLKERFQSTRPNALFDQKDEIYQEHAKQANIFWVENYDPEFTCQHERKVGPLGDGGKWVCDPHRIDKDNCIVYSVGSCGDFTFEEAVLKDVSKSCEIHTFDVLAERNGEDFAELAKKAGVEFHHYGLGSPGRGNPNGKRFKDIIPELKHEGKTIDMMKIDCESCEWGQYVEWIEDWTNSGVKVRTLLIELHKAPLPATPDFFKKMLDAGYIIYHKDINGLRSLGVEYGFVLLHEDFQKA